MSVCELTRVWGDVIMSYLTEASNTMGQMLSAGQYGAIIIVVACICVAYQGIRSVFRVIASVIACLAVIYLINPNLYNEVLRIAYYGFNAVCNAATQIGG